jgi:hypothetical protein
MRGERREAYPVLQVRVPNSILLEALPPGLDADSYHLFDQRELTQSPR